MSFQWKTEARYTIPVRPWNFRVTPVGRARNLVQRGNRTRKFRETSKEKRPLTRSFRISTTLCALVQEILNFLASTLYPWKRKNERNPNPLCLRTKCKIKDFGYQKESICDHRRWKTRNVLVCRTCRARDTCFESAVNLLRNEFRVITFRRAFWCASLLRGDGEIEGRERDRGRMKMNPSHELVFVYRAFDVSSLVNPTLSLVRISRVTLFQQSSVRALFAYMYIIWVIQNTLKQHCNETQLYIKHETNLKEYIKATR